MASKSNEIFLGIDVGSVSTKMVVLDADSLSMLDSLYVRTYGDPQASMRAAMIRLSNRQPLPVVRTAATTGSGRTLAGRLINTNIIKNEITTHTLAAVKIMPEVRTIVEIGGQDSKIIIVRDGMAVDFAMNTVCAAGTGSFLDQQSGRLGIRVEDMGEIALSSNNPASISGRCTVFAETDMIHKQQIGAPMNDIVAGLCRALVKNYLASVARGKPITPPVVFQGGVAANKGIVREFQEQTGCEIHVSPYYGVAGAYGAALLASMVKTEQPAFQGLELSGKEHRIKSFVCKKCEESCSVLMLYRDGALLSYWNDRCGRYSSGEVTYNPLVTTGEK
ncbi:CoA-substrate-specific enzyme activase [uncultured Desulfobacterium sp.]|uniref:CoA-substrate-specific enzyme activase n=1 Tax=uncultured Desulfobacterium sp. TaxID=201089 RepID=A0A445MZA8_9BACT|nr:CoA-substrate-specific enzyme activase [uncultured Desulfobacterium sp.]